MDKPISVKEIKQHKFAEEDIKTFVERHIKAINQLLLEEKAQLNEKRYEKYGLFSFRKREVKPYITFSFHKVFSVNYKLSMNLKLVKEWVAKICEEINKTYEKDWNVTYIISETPYIMKFEVNLYFEEKL